MVKSLGLLLLLCCRAAFAADDLPENLARTAQIEASSMSNESLAAANVADGRIPQAGAALGEAGSWAVDGAKAKGRGQIAFRWAQPVTISHVIYFGRTAWGPGEVFKDYEIYGDDASKPLAKGTFAQQDGPQHVRFPAVQTRSLTLRFLSSYGGPNPGAAEIMIFPSRLTEKQFARVLKFSVNSLFNDHMVVQRGQPLRVFGTAEDGERVSVSFRGREVETVAAHGQWLAELPAAELGPPGELTIRSAAGHYTIHDVLVGDVWVASGQSNMEMPVDVRVWPSRYDGAVKAKQEVAAANYPQIREFYLPRVASYEARAETGGNWQICSPKTAGGFSAVAYFFARKLHRELSVPVGLIDASWGATYIEPWTPADAIRSQPEMAKTAASMPDIFAAHAKAVAANPASVPPAHQHIPSALFQGMIYRLTRYPIRGAIWYQGEGNVGDGMLYFHKMQALIGGWRAAWNIGDFPFLYVQLAPYDYGLYKGPKDPLLLPALWEAQTRALSIPNTGMVVTNDISDVRNIHPPDKQDVGLRLALCALAMTYGKPQFECFGPMYKSMDVEKGRIRVHFDHADGGIVSADGKPLTWFTLAGEDKVFHPARAEIDGSTVVVSSDAVPEPVAVRFAWHKLAQPNLKNKAGLPAPAFRSDQW